LDLDIRTATITITGAITTTTMTLITSLVAAITTALNRAKITSIFVTSYLATPVTFFSASMSGKSIIT
jgi:hypothetical protein